MKQKITKFPNPNPNGKPLIDCPGCGKRKEHEAKGHCKSCYNHKIRKPREIICPRCKRKMPHHGKGLCMSCYMFVYQYEKIRASNVKRNYGIDFELYKQKTKSCILCGFDKIVDLHHLNENKKDNSPKNLVGLCPNHHKMIHHEKYREYILSEVKKRC